MTFYKLIQGNAFQILPTIEDEGIDLILTDPPYNILKNDDIEINNMVAVRNAEFDNNKLDIPKLVYEIYRILKDGGTFYIFMSDRQIGEYIENIEKQGLYYSNTLVWFQKNGFPSIRKRAYQNHCQYIAYGHKEINKNYVFNFKSPQKMRNLLQFDGCVSFEYKGGSPGEYLGHPTQKPSKLIKHLIEVSSNRGDLILDPFLGSGTTMKVARDLGRSCIGIEIDPKYCEMAKKRCFAQQFLDRKVEYQFMEVVAV